MPLAPGGLPYPAGNNVTEQLFPGAATTPTTTVGVVSGAPVQASQVVTTGTGSLGVLQTLDHLLNPPGGILGSLNIVQDGEVILARLAGVAVGGTLLIVGLGVLAFSAIGGANKAVNGVSGAANSAQSTVGSVASLAKFF